MSDDTSDTEEPADEIHGYSIERAAGEEPEEVESAIAGRMAPIGPEHSITDLKRTTDVIGSPVIRTASRTLTPFVVAFGIYLTLFGTDRPGGAFQGGVVMASAIVLIAISFGFRNTQEWLDARALAGMFLLGAGIFGAVAFGALVYGGAVLELFVFPLSVENMVKLVEVAIAALVTGVIIGLMFWIATGFQSGGEDA
ncbi:MnhB domain-containing protein [Natranaeroarchaeum sulfidigenes]|uniref:Multisubunit Na+/H+ antiporter, MnhB subunit n=1 Tax=Natranaeroarchaeum sulfidigenes TaxID=2784880 RepID=A0A897MVL2_9EURY|nr:MnhB domain-containing protein [Natranaeroarchaeum sulfidigenes]QSG03103.1 Multisubunit Na+/H+ antiporter, MnhB subunit [Natranaeroarchaeum sulfidigenes]